ncbi:MAG: glycoside hydrolase [Clostridia bacterium]|nr:glycoside hydrolase [Clostridia bacterium]
MFNGLRNFLKKPLALLTTAALITGSIFYGPGSILPTAKAEETAQSIQRLAGKTRYETAVQIAENWDEAYNVVLTRGDTFPDALAGAVLANSPQVNGPLLLTEPDSLRSEVLNEMKRLRANKVYILGGTAAVSAEVENTLKNNGMDTVRIEGSNRYETAAKIATTSVPNSTKAFLASGQTFPDALSISAYAAANNIPLLLTDVQKVPEATLNALQELGVAEVTLIGGESVISPAAADQLTEAGYRVDRLSGSNRYDTNTAILNALDFDTSNMVIATGTAFPDALAGSVLAAKEYNPIVLVPQDENALLESETLSYLNNKRDGVSTFFILGGLNVINYKVENIVRTGKYNARVSLQYWAGYANKANYEDQLNLVPSPFTDYIQILSPNCLGELQPDGSFAYRFSSAETPKYLVSLGQSKGARVVPLIMITGKGGSEVLRSSSKRATFISSAEKVIRETNADGILVDAEALDDDLAPHLISLMRDLYTKLHSQGKLVLLAVPAKTGANQPSWNKEYDYSGLAPYADYIQIMSYDKHYSTSAPGPIAPLDWVREVMAYASTQIPTEKILMGIPYYGRSWRVNNQGTGWTSEAFGLAGALKKADQYGATITRETTPTDPVGIPTFKYVDESGRNWTAYFDDRLSWTAKLDLLDRYNLGGVGGWAMNWIIDTSAPELYPLLKERMQ